MTALGHVWRWFDEEPHRRSGVRALRVLLGVGLLFRLVTELPYADYFWGPHGVAHGTCRRVFGAWLGASLDTLFESNLTVYAICGALAVSAMLLVVGFFERAASAVGFLMFVLLESRLPETLDGGDNIVRLALLFSVMMLPSRAVARPRSLGVWFHNLGVTTIAIQLALVYFVAGTMKIAGSTWRDGTALYYISHVQAFTHPLSRTLFENAIASTLACYATVLHQLWFPVAIISRLKVTWIVFGVCFHGGIAYTMGLVTFSTFMVGLELSLLTDRELAVIASRLRASWQAMRRALGRLLVRDRVPG